MGCYFLVRYRHLFQNRSCLPLHCFSCNRAKLSGSHVCWKTLPAFDASSRCNAQLSIQLVVVYFLNNFGFWTPWNWTSGLHSWVHSSASSSHRNTGSVTRSSSIRLVRSSNSLCWSNHRTYCDRPGTHIRHRANEKSAGEWKTAWSIAASSNRMDCRIVWLPWSQDCQRNSAVAAAMCAGILLQAETSISDRDREIILNNDGVKALDVGNFGLAIQGSKKH